jgi:hypothetical protein
MVSGAIMFAVAVSFLAGLFCLGMAPSFAVDWLASFELSEELVPDADLDDDVDPLDGVQALAHALVASVLGVGFLTFACQLFERLGG